MVVRVKDLKTALKYQKNQGQANWSLPYIIRKIKSLEKRLKSDEAWIAKALTKLRKQ